MSRSSRRANPSLSHAIRSLHEVGIQSAGRRVAWLGFLSFASGLSEAGVLILLSTIAVVAAQRTSGVHVGPLSASTLGALVIALALVICRFVAGYLAAGASGSLAADALKASRAMVVRRFFNATWAAQSAERLGDVQQLLTVNAERVAYMALSLSQALGAALSLLALLGAALAVDPISALGVLVIGLVLYVVFRPLNRASGRASADQVRNTQNLATLATSHTRLAREFRLAGVEDIAVSKLLDANDDTAASYRRVRFIALIVPVVYQSAALFLVIAGLGIVVSRSTTNLGLIGAVLLLILRSFSYGQTVQQSSQQFNELSPYVDDLKERLTKYSAVVARGQKPPVPLSFDVCCQHACFEYVAGHQVLQDISFELLHGESLGVIGESGSGKTTLAQLLLGLREPVSGVIRVGGLPPSSLIQHDGPSPIGFVSQEPILLHGSIASNVALFRDVSQGELEQACIAAHIHDDILTMPDGYRTQVGDGGIALSGGQRQRLAIARALVGRPELLILDEPTSALDGRSESLIRETVAELRGRVTVVLISHRLAMVAACDRLLVLHNKRQADFGPAEDVRRRTPFQRVQKHVAGR